MVELSEQFGQPYFPHRGSPEKRAQPVQGKLFSDPKPTDENRYQRGYTPERMEAMRQQPIRIISGSGRQPANAPFTGYGGVHRAWQTLARSTMPADTIRQRDHYGTDSLAIRTASGEVKYSGHYTYPPNGMRGDIHLSRREGGEREMGRTLMHEMGHAHSDQEHLPHARPGSRVNLGREEAYADDFKEEHWRPDPRDVRRGAGRDPSVNTMYESPGGFKNIPVSFAPHEGRGFQKGGKTAEKAYNQARRTPNQRDAYVQSYRNKNKDAAFQPRLNTDQFHNRSWYGGDHPVINELEETKDRMAEHKAKQARTKGPFG